MKRLTTVVLGLALLLSGSATGLAVARPGSVLATRNVSVVNFAFMPRSATVPVGTTVRWKNNATNTTHTTTSNTGLWNRTLAPGATFSRVFNQAGTFRYHCSIHAQMTAQIVVTG